MRAPERRSPPYWRLSAFYAFYFGTIGALMPYWSLYLKYNGFNATQIGELSAILIATKIISPNLLGWLADKSGKRLPWIRSTTFLSAVLFAGFLYRRDYLWFVLVTAVFSFFWNAALPQFEAATLSHLRKTPQHYSRIRLWGSVGFIAAVLGVGWFLDYADIHYLPAIIGALMAGIWLSAMLTPECNQIHPHADRDSGELPPGTAEIVAFFAVYMLLQIAHGPYYVFFSVYLKQHDYTASLTGQLWALGVCAEIVMFSCAGRLLKWFSLRSLLLSSLALTVLRWWLIAYQVQELAIIVFAQLLHAASFGIAHVVAIQLLSRYFGTRYQGRGQAFYASICYGLGGMLGSLYSGYYWDSLGAALVFVLAALVSGAAFLIAFIWVGKERQF